MLNCRSWRALKTWFQSPTSSAAPQKLSRLLKRKRRRRTRQWSRRGTTPSRRTGEVPPPGLNSPARLRRRKLRMLARPRGERTACGLKAAASRSNATPAWTPSPTGLPWVSTTTLPHTSRGWPRALPGRGPRATRRRPPSPSCPGRTSPTSPTSVPSAGCPTTTPSPWRAIWSRCCTSPAAGTQESLQRAA